MLINANVVFYFEDTFTDPYRLRDFLNDTSDPEQVSGTWRRLSDAGGLMFRISDTWSSNFQTEARLSEVESRYKNKYGWTE